MERELAEWKPIFVNQLHFHTLLIEFPGKINPESKNQETNSSGFYRVTSQGLLNLPFQISLRD